MRPFAALDFDPIAEARRQWLEHWGEAPAPAMTATTSIMRVQQILMTRLNRMLRPWDLSFPRYEALMLLYYSRRGSLPLGKMGVRLQVHATSVTNLVDGLERLGLARREPHSHDRRTTLATITARGRAVAREATATLNAERFGVGEVGDADLERLSDILRAVRADAGDFPVAPPVGSAAGMEPGMSEQAGR